MLYRLFLTKSDMGKLPKSCFKRLKTIDLKVIGPENFSEHIFHALGVVLDKFGHGKPAQIML